MMVSRMTTELFHAQLEENIVRAADERRRHQEELKAISRNYEETLGNIERMEDVAGENYRRARNAFEDAKKVYQEALRECRMHRNEAGLLRDEAKVRRLTFGLSTTIPSRATATKSLRDTEKRGGDFREQKQNSCTPGWTKDKKGGVSDEEK